MEKTLQSRFAHLLQPIRDLTKNWDVDVASRLEEYLTEIEPITISFDGGATKMNFAEAALLIQGSTCVYSKKVEYLYALVYQTLDLIASKRKLAQVSSLDDHGKDTDVSFAQRREEEGLLMLNGLPEATNIDMMETPKSPHSDFKTVSTIPRTPMSLIPLQESEKVTSTPLLSRTGELLGSKVDFKMNASSVHLSGALLLEPMNQLVIDTTTYHKEPILLTFDTSARNISPHTLGGPENIDVAPPDVSMFGDDGAGYSDDDEVLPLSPTVAEEQKPAPRRARVRVQEKSRIEDPWKLLDPHDPSGATKNRPCKKGTTFKVLPSLAKPTSRKRKKSVKATPAEPLAQFILKSFYSCSSMFPKNRLKAPLSSEFEGLYWAEQKARKLQKQKDNITLSRMKKESVVTLDQQVLSEEEDNVEDYHPLGQDDDYDDDGGGGVPEYGAGVEGALEGFGGDLISGLFHGVEPMALEDPSGSDHQVVQNYEDLVRNYVESTLASALTYAQETELSRRVQEWEDRIKPVLNNQESHPVFDIHLYGSNILKTLEGRNLTAGKKLYFYEIAGNKTQFEICRLFAATLQLESHPVFDIHLYGSNILKTLEGRNLTAGKKLYFYEIAGNKTQFEICRLFAATLQLANDYNVQISSDGTGEEHIDTMGLTLLSTKTSHENVSKYRAPSLHGQ